jgi:hypothetical protein
MRHLALVAHLGSFLVLTAASGCDGGDETSSSGDGTVGADAGASEAGAGTETGASTAGATSAGATSAEATSADATSPGDASSSTSPASSGADETGPSDGNVSASSDGGEPPDCAPLSDCEACGAMDGCGWCGATGTCSAGGEVGPSEGACSGGWVIEGDFFSCPAANCFSRTTCGECQDAFTGCGWCASTGSCMAGAPDMPAAPAACAEGQWYFDICPEDCASEMTCVSCTGTVGCGWCAGSSSCTAGTEAGPLQGACASGWSVDVDPCF